MNETWTLLIMCLATRKENSTGTKNRTLFVMCLATREENSTGTKNRTLFVICLYSYTRRVLDLHNF